MKFNRFFIEFYEELLSNPSEVTFLFMTGKTMGKKLLEKQDGMIDIDLMKKIIETRNLGNLSLKEGDHDKGEFIFNLDNTAFKTNIGKKSCYVISGMLAGFVEKHYGKYAGSQEIKCVSKGDPCCEFHVRVVEE